MRLCKLALVFGVVALLASPVLAQPGRGGRGGFGPGQILRVEKVQKDMGIDKDQMTKVDDAMKKVNDDMKDEMAKLGRDSTASDEEKAAARKKIAEATDKALKDVLNEKQQKRLKQIQRQLAGINIFQDEEFLKTVKLTDEQKDKVKEINKDLDKEMADLRSGGFNAETFAKMATLRKDAMTNAMKTLTDDQKKQMKEMTGEPLELTPQDLGGGRGRPGAGKPRTDF